MRNLIAFLWKNYFFFLFLILEAFAFFLIINNNYYQRRVIVNSTTDVTGNILQSYDNFTSYFNLKEVNRQLAEENAAFHNMSPEAFIRTDTNVFFRNDTLNHRHYRFISAKVISASVNRLNNYIKLNKGRTHGIEPDMAVVAPNGVIGQVVEVSDHFSSVMSVLNSQTRISAKLKKSNQVGSLYWNGEDYRMGKLIDIPSHVQFSIGDTVVTSGYSFIYPEGWLIGIVEDFSIEPGDNFFKIDVKFSVDYNNISYVYVVKNRFRNELMDLENSELKE